MIFFEEKYAMIQHGVHWGGGAMNLIDNILVSGFGLSGFKRVEFFLIYDIQ